MVNKAKGILLERGAALVLYKEGSPLWVDYRQGLLPLWEAVNHRQWQGAFLADKVVGRGAAFLAATAGITTVYTPLMSKGGEQILRAQKIYVEAECVVPSILNREGQALCPMESLLSEVEDPREACRLIEEAMARMQSGSR